MITRRITRGSLRLLALRSAERSISCGASAYWLLRRRSPRALHFTILAIALSFTSRASAQNSVWIGGTSTWYDPAGWQGGVPNSTRHAFINNGGVVRHLLSIPAEANLLILGFSAGQSGTVQVTAPVPLTITSDLIMGVGGTGTLAISNGGDVTARSAVLGFSSNSMGTMTVAGAGSTVKTQVTSGQGGELIVGRDGAGALIIESGAVVSSDSASLAQGSGTGTATVRGAGSAWYNTYALSVGLGGMGSLSVEDGATVISSIASAIADSVGSTGNVTVTGQGSNWTIYLGLPVGINGTGTLTIADGGTVDVRDFSIFGSNIPGPVTINAASTLNIGAGGLAGALVAGTLENDGTLNFNHSDSVAFSIPISGAGTIFKNGTGITTLSNSSAFAGTITASVGELVLQEALSAAQYTATGGTLRFSGGTVNMTAANSIRSNGGAVEFSGTTVNGGVLCGNLPGAGGHTIVSNVSNTRFNGVIIQNSVELIQDGAANFSNVTNGGRLTSNAFLFFDGGANATSGNIIVNGSFNTREFTNYGQITINAGGSLFHKLGNLASGGDSRTMVNTGGLLNLMDGSQLDLNGGLLVNNGTISGTVNVNYGSLAKGAGVYQHVIVADGGVYAPGNSPGVSTAESVAFDNTLTSSGGPTLQIELAGAAPGAGYDQLHVTGQLSLGGTLAVSLIDSFMPTAGSLFDILDWGSLSGTFSTLTLPTLAAGLRWDASQLYTAGVLSVAPAFTADFDEDGDVDGDDLARWNSGFGAGTTHMQGDADGDLDVDGADFLTWQRQLGSGTPSVAATAAVPEPATLLLLVSATLAMFVPLRVAVP